MLKVDPNEEKISLGMKQTEQDPWMVLPLKYPVGTRINGKVRNLTSFGAFVEIEPGIDGLIHISDMSWTKRVQHPSEVVKKGDAVDVVILNIDAENKRISLGLKQAEEDPWLQHRRDLSGRHRSCAARVVRLMDKGVVVDIGNDIEGFVPMSQLGVGQHRESGRRGEGRPAARPEGARGGPDPSPDRPRGRRLSGRADHPADQAGVRRDPRGVGAASNVRTKRVPSRDPFSYSAAAMTHGGNR